jgi:cation diffusion facilitator family transporter
MPISNDCLAKINVFVNILLLAAKGVAAIWSSSLSLIASLVDSALDLLCTIIIWTTNKLVGWRLTKLKKIFPIGRRRLEPIGILVFSIIMVISFMQILKESVEKLLPGGKHDVAELPPAAIFAMVATIVVKGTIWFGCARVKTTQVQALAQDCKTDVYFNTLSLLFPLVGHKFHVWWLDPLGASLLSLFIIYDWAGTCLENVMRLTGEAANDGMERKVMFMAYRFAPLVDGFKSMKCYHAGDGVCVEIDILMPEDAPLRRCHDVAETLQYCLEGLNEVDRAFVTIDCKCHRQRQRIRMTRLTWCRFFTRADGSRDCRR